MPSNPTPQSPEPSRSANATPSSKRKTSKARPNARTTPEANAEHLLLQQLALHLGQEAARQNDIPTHPYLPLHPGTGSPHLTTLEGVNADTVKLRTTVTITVNARTGAAIALHLPPRPKTR